MPPPFERGLYETLLSQNLASQVREATADGQLTASRRDLDKAEASDRLAYFVGETVRRAVESYPEAERVALGLKVARQITKTLIASDTPGIQAADLPEGTEPVLSAIVGRMPDGKLEEIPAPTTPLLDTTVLTNAPGEPRLLQQLVTEIPSASRIDLVMAFIRRSGTRPLIAALEKHCAAGGALRVLTTVFTGTTEARALEQLRGLGAEVRVSYDLRATRLHAKSWVFHRAHDMTTAYVGSSNLTRAGQVDGLEWNVRLSAARNRSAVEKLEAVFDAYWESGDFVDFDTEEFERRSPQQGSGATATTLPPTELRLEPFQERMLEQIEVSRRFGCHQNLLVSATGTGKTVMAAVDYSRLRRNPGSARLLFVAHREEILRQSLDTFRYALRDGTFGELWVGGKSPDRWEHVFASIQSLNAAGYADLAPDHFDVVIVDEFHHASASTYAKLLSHVQPKELLGLTATPERADGASILKYFDDRIAAELRLWDAIDQRYLVPFHYYAIHDGSDLTSVGWVRGRGYDPTELTGVLTADSHIANLVRQQLVEHVEDPTTFRALGFCVSVAHAEFMASEFSRNGIAAVAVSGDSDKAARKQALADLRSGSLHVVFSVDLFNEGVDVPAVDTLLLLRPTESATVFLQQLGRGLRRADAKSACLVLDFVGHHRKEFRFDKRLGALTGGTRRELTEQIRNGFPFLPAGCHLELQPQAREIILSSIRNALPSTSAQKRAELTALRNQRGDGIDLATFLYESGLELEDVYAGTKSWSDLKEAAGLPVHPPGPLEAALRRACGRLLHVDDAHRIDSYLDALSGPTPPRLSGDPNALGTRILRMLTAQMLYKQIDRDTNLTGGLRVLWEHPQILAELRELFTVLRTRITHATTSTPGHPAVPLQIHARYTRLEIMAALGSADRAQSALWQTGVTWVDHEQVDALAFTLDKSASSFSPTTRYRDYAISRDLIHWESQSVTRAESATGQRYQNHARDGSSVFLFARENTRDRAFWFLGSATYVKHTGERPMAITWRLSRPLPGDLYAAFAAAVA